MNFMVSACDCQPFGNYCILQKVENQSSWTFKKEQWALKGVILKMLANCLRVPCLSIHTYCYEYLKENIRQLSTVLNSMKYQNLSAIHFLLVWFWSVKKINRPICFYYQTTGIQLSIYRLGLLSCLMLQDKIWR